jgi:two-component system cell cycle response regulator
MVDGLRESYALDAVSVVLSTRSMRSGICCWPAAIARGVQADLLRRFVGRSGAATRRAAQAVAGPFVGADHHLLFPGIRQSQEHGTGAAAAQGSRHRRSVLRQPRPTRFTRHHGTDFLAHLGAVAAVCIENAVNRARLLRAGITDFLTGWHNRRYLQQRLKEELARAQRRAAASPA